MLYFQDGIETIDAAYIVFLREGFDGFDGFSFEFKTTATKSLSPHRIKEYLTIIHREQGLPACQVTMDYVVVVMGKYLQMLVAHSIFKDEPDRVTDHFEEFNRDFYKVCDAFKEVTDQDFTAGQEVEVVKPVAMVKPTVRESKAELGLSDNERVTLLQFLERHSLQELLAVFLKEGVALQDLLEMTDNDMKGLGIKAFGLRKRLLRVIEKDKAGETTATSFEEQPGEQSDSRAGSLTDSSLTNEMLAMRLHLEEVQNSSSSRYSKR